MWNITINVRLFWLLTHGMWILTRHQMLDWIPWNSWIDRVCESRRIIHMKLAYFDGKIPIYNFKNDNFIQCYRHYILVASLSMCFIVLEMNLHPKFLFTCIWQISQIIINFTIFYLQIFHTIAIILLIISTLILLIGITQQMLSYHNTIFDYEVPFIVAMFVASVSFITGTQQFVIPSAMIKRKLIDFDICDFISFF